LKHWHTEILAHHLTGAWSEAASRWTTPR
jgi:hypothetical protein